MKEIMVLFLALLIIFAGFPALADQGTAQQESFFQKASDSLSKTGKPTAGQKPSAWVSVFQKSANNIATWNKTTNDAKSLSLRGNEDEIARRRKVGVQQ